MIQVCTTTQWIISSTTLSVIRRGWPSPLESFLYAQNRLLRATSFELAGADVRHGGELSAPLTEVVDDIIE
jgi:hypothetical protein